jgi:hypothetical protein
MNLTPQEFIKRIIAGESERELNKLENPMIDTKEVQKLIKKYGHTAQSAREYLETDYSNGFTICRNCGTYYHLGKGFSKHMSKGCLHCEGEEKHYTYWHEGNNESNYKTEPRYMSVYFDDGMHYCRDKAEKAKFQGLITAIELTNEPQGKE